MSQGPAGVSVAAPALLTSCSLPRCLSSISILLPVLSMRMTLPFFKSVSRNQKRPLAASLTCRAATHMRTPQQQLKPHILHCEVSIHHQHSDKHALQDGSRLLVCTTKQLQLGQCPFTSSHGERPILLHIDVCCSKQQRCHKRGRDRLCLMVVQKRSQLSGT